MTIPKEIRIALQEAETAYIVTTTGTLIQSFVMGQGCQCCVADQIIDSLSQVIQAEAEQEQIPPILTGLLESINHEFNRQN